MIQRAVGNYVTYRQWSALFLEPFSGEKLLTVHPRLSRDKQRRDVGGRRRRRGGEPYRRGQAEKIVGGRSDERRGEERGERRDGKRGRERKRQERMRTTR